MTGCEICDLQIQSSGFSLQKCFIRTRNSFFIFLHVAKKIDNSKLLSTFITILPSFITVIINISKCLVLLEYSFLLFPHHMSFCHHLFCCHLPSPLVKTLFLFSILLLRCSKSPIFQKERNFTNRMLE
ncbi:hypothetical protein CW304_11850 [Bacillus sp. UFRGS-B20]|nr:hypothetical protein CW304_11850 [Bacillus sp. UFRGS-B20]